MEIERFAGLSHTVQTVAVATIIFAACVYLSNVNYRSQLAKLPAFGGAGGNEKHRKAYLQSAKDMYSEGYRKFKNSVYRIVSEDGQENVVVPPSLLPELRKLPDSVLSFPKAIDKLMEVKYTKVDSDQPLIIHSIKADLTPALARLNPVICEISEQAVAQEMPPCDDWTPVPIYIKLANMVAKISGRIFVGPELCHDPEYLDAGINYTTDLIVAQRALKQIRPILKPFVGPRLPEVKRLREREEKAKAFLAPVIQARQDAEANDPNWEKPDDLLQWFLARGDDYGIKTAEQMSKLQLGITFAAIHTTTMTVTNILYSLAVTPEYIEPIRDEIRQVLAENDGSITSRALQQMVKLDSYMKEVMRYYPPGATSFTRKVLKGITLSNGQYIPPGVVLEVPAWAIYRDDANYPDGDTFDGFRHYKLRQSGTATDHARNQFVTTNETNLAFGYGRHACPGRFFAASEIKMMLARLVLDYDFKNVEGEVERYPNIETGRSSAPDPRRVLMFKKVKV
ncbi:ent-kaurene oxidase [Corynespora cassiicola Philippines]|uniref:Ent-kaurene oxidase n=1 Tax=Corynespora cassiicola Philippines TaxID=1448308 RepID=A0A2T2NTW7_CORCC|nr:ent-kaurene oxidase [Corynespora cassiicola Philippines]